MAPEIRHLKKNDQRNDFDCGYELLNTYLQKQVSQDIKRSLADCYVLVNPESKVWGYYTLSSNSIPKEDLPSTLAKKLPPSYTDIPTVLLGRLAVDFTQKGRGYGELLLMDALLRCLGHSESVGTMAVVTDPMDDKAVEFYKHYGFILLPGSGKMFMPIKTVKGLGEY
jgi:GNAT superfamily N-acetyltransferase